MSSRTIVDRPIDTAISDALAELALDLRWSFNHSADQLWEQLDPELWELTHNPGFCCKLSPGKSCKLLPPTQDFKDSLLISTAIKCRRKVGSVVSKGASGFGRVDDCVFLDGVHVERSAADLFWRTW
jgi:hypothetical protein